MNEGQGFAALDSKEDSHASAVPSLSNRTFDLTAPAPILIPFAPNAAPTAAASSAPSTSKAHPKLKPKIGLKVFWLSPTTTGENEKAEIVSNLSASAKTSENEIYQLFGVLFAANFHSARPQVDLWRTGGTWLDPGLDFGSHTKMTYTRFRQLLQALRLSSFTVDDQKASYWSSASYSCCRRTNGPQLTSS